MLTDPDFFPCAEQPSCSGASLSRDLTDSIEVPLA